MPKNLSKSLIRRVILTRLRSISPEQRAEESCRLRRLLSSELEIERTINIGLYFPLPHEVDLIPLLCEHPQHRYAFPRCLAGHQMSFHIVRNLETDLEPGAHGILAPRETLPIMEPEDIDLLIIPGVAFTAEGQRLGYGGGYYDRYIPRCAHAKLLSLAFQVQMLESLPYEPHDQLIPTILNA